MQVGLHLAFEQWGTFGYVNDGDYIAMPLSGTPLQVVVNDMADNTNPLCLSTLDYVEGKFKVRGCRIDSTTGQLWGHWIAVCKQYFTCQQLTIVRLGMHSNCHQHQE